MRTQLTDVREALEKTPLEPYVRLERDREHPELPLVTPHAESPWLWQAAIYLVNKSGTPIWWPASRERARAVKFYATFVVSEDPATNYLRAKNAAQELAKYARKKLIARRAGIKSVMTKRILGIVTKGRPKGIPRALERTGKNRDRLCLDCGKKAGSHKTRGGHGTIACNEAFKGERA